MFECIRSFLVLHFVLSLYRQLITKSLIHYITQRYLTQSPKVFLQWNKVWLMSLPFYEKCGFVLSHIIPNFFTDNYDHPIYEGGVQLVDMVYLQRKF